MVRNRTETNQTNRSEDEENGGPLPRFFVDAAAAPDRALPIMVASRRCYQCQQADDEPDLESTDSKSYIDQIAQHCAETSDYLLPDTPLKEAIFRVLLAGNNEPMNAEEISQVLVGKWELTAYPRDVSTRVIKRLLDHCDYYCLAQVPEAEPEETEASE